MRRSVSGCLVTPITLCFDDAAGECRRSLNCSRGRRFHGSGTTQPSECRPAAGELATLLRDQMQQRDGRWCLVDLIGKGGRVRTVAIPDWTQQAVALWLEAMPIKEGPVLGKVNKGGRFVGAGMSPLSFTLWWPNTPSGSASISARKI
jgi:hypothetical protein